jgi:hypothetical protein
MKVIDPGHTYELRSLDGGSPQMLRFVKRCDRERPWRFPGNTDAYPGTTLQNVIRALLERFRYLQSQIPCVENRVCILCLRVTLWMLEFRAARRHKRTYIRSLSFAEYAPMCAECGHTDCNHDEAMKGV